MKFYSTNLCALSCWNHREAGVRSLKKLLEKIYRKSALTLVKRGGPGVPPDTLSGSGPVVAADSSAAQAADGGAKGSVPGDVTAASGSGADGRPAAAESSPSAVADGQATLESSDSNPTSASSNEGDMDTAASSAPVASSDSQQPDGQLPATSPQVKVPCTGLAAHCSKA